MHLFKRFIVTPYFHPEDGAMAGGADDQGDTGADAVDASNVEATDGDGDAGDDAGDADGHDGSQHEDDEERLLFGEDSDDQDDARPIEDRHKRLSAAHNKLKRRFGKAWPTVKALKDAGITNIPDVVARARNFDALLERVGGDTARLTRLIEGLNNQADDGARDTRTAARGAKDTTDEVEQLTDAQYAELWDTTTPAGKHFVAQDRLVRSLRSELKTTQSRLDKLEGGISQDKQASVRQAWLNPMTAAAAKIKDPDVRDVFTDLVKSAFNAARAAGKNVDPNTVISHYLKKLKVAPGEARIAAAAGQQRMAQANSTRPQHKPNGGAGHIQPARGKKESVADVNRRIRSVGR